MCAASAASTSLPFEQFAWAEFGSSGQTLHDSARTGYIECYSREGVRSKEGTVLGGNPNKSGRQYAPDLSLFT